MPKGEQVLDGAKPKPKTKRRRKVKPESTLAPMTARFVSVEKSMPPVQAKARSWGLAIVQILFAVIVIIGAYILFHQLQKVREEAKKREAVLQEQLKHQVAGVQSKFDELLDTWQKQKAAEISATARVDFKVDGLALSGSHLASLGELVKEGTNYRFSANPDIFGAPGGLMGTCREPLLVDETGYCDNVVVDGVPAFERVDVLYNADDQVDSIMKSVQVTLADGQVFQWSVDLGSPVIEGRDVFAPVNTNAQTEALSSYLRAILKHEDLPEVLAENLNAFDDLIQHLDLRP